MMNWLLDKWDDAILRLAIGPNGKPNAFGRWLLRGL